jgi:hypothetical protein
MSLNTAFLLMAQYNGKAIIPLDEVRRDFFSHLTLPKFLRKLSSGDIALPLMRIETSQKCAKGNRGISSWTGRGAKTLTARQPSIVGGWIGGLFLPN